MEYVPIFVCMYVNGRANSVMLILYLWHDIYKHCTTSQKVACSIPDGVTGIFHWLNPSCCTVVLGLTQPQTEMSTRSIPGG